MPSISNSLKEQLKQIPILDVCSQVLNITPEKRSSTYWCKCRAGERTASTRLYTDENCFYDYGTNTGGDVIELVKYTLDVDFVTAVKMLQDAFHIPDPNEHTSVPRHTLMDWEYNCIGLYGDRATKNFRFDVDRMSLDHIQQISEKYAMPMNELRKKHPKIYRRLLIEHALPYVRALRANYLLAVWNHYQFCCKHVTPDYFYVGDMRQKFAEDLNPLIQAEHILRKAAYKTGISLSPPREYDPAKDLDSLLSGTAKPDLGKLTYAELQSLAREKGCNIRYRTVPYDNFCPTGKLEQFPYSAFLKSGNVTIGYLETDHSALDPILDAMRPLPKQRHPRKPIPSPQQPYSSKGKGAHSIDHAR